MSRLFQCIPAMAHSGARFLQWPLRNITTHTTLSPHHSTTPPLHHSTTALLHYCTNVTALLHYCTTTSLTQYSAPLPPLHSTWHYTLHRYTLTHSLTHSLTHTHISLTHTFHSHTHTLTHSLTTRARRTPRVPQCFRPPSSRSRPR